jgi:glycine/D-amino acid oxidase-like deaminating enzyme
MRIAIVGNGSLGMFAAIQAKMSFKDAEIIIFGPAQRPLAASTAAGAMANVYAEMEHSEGSLLLANERYLEMGKIGTQMWRKFLSETNGSECITSGDTFVYLQENCSKFEESNYEAVIKYAKSDGVLEILSVEEIAQIFPIHANRKVKSAIRIKGEFSFSVYKLFLHLDLVASKMGIKVDNSNVLRIDLENLNLETENEILNFDRIIVTAGVHSKQLLRHSSMLPLYQGVGVAMLINPVQNIEMQKLNRGVFRSVNRGGAQCGIHLVPREDGKYYLGAGNYVSKVQEPVIRLDTIRYLLATLENDLIGRESAYELTGEFKLGLRPRSLDGFPMIGPLRSNSKIFVATGTNRAGLTWAPFIAREIIHWLKEAEVSKLISGWEPERNPIPYGSESQGINYFAHSRLSNSLEHGLISRDANEAELSQKFKEFSQTAQQIASQVSKKLSLPSGTTINPDNWAAILSEN